MTLVRKHYRQVKKALRRRDPLDTYFVSMYSFSPYAACEHGCLYCDGRAEKYYVDGDFERDVVVRENLPDCLSEELPKLREKGTICIGSGISDPYQPAEEREGIMQACAEILTEHDVSVSVMTKSSLVLRDIDFWTTVNGRSRFTLMVSLSTTDERVRKRFEPRASSIQDRLGVLRAFKERGCAVGVAAMPFLPFISDTRSCIQQLFDELSAAGVDFILPGGLTLRPGRQKELYLSVIDDHFSSLAASYRELYGKNRPSGVPLPRYHQELMDMVREIQTRTSIPSRIPHRIYRGQFPLYNEILILMDHMVHIYQVSGVSTKRLDRSLRRYRDWLDAELRVFRRSRSQRSVTIEEKTLAMICSGQFAELVANERLGRFFAEMVREDKVFNYYTRELERDV